MADRNDLLSDRDEAGARYAAAITELRNAYVELHALDTALLNQRVVGLRASSETFRGDFDFVPPELRHPKYVPNPPVSIADASRTRAVQILGTYNGVPRE